MAGRMPVEQGEVLSKTRRCTKKPRLYKILLHNDDYTPMDFVVMILQTVFHKSRPDAVQIMLSVHTRGHGLAGVYSREVAETKLSKVLALAQTKRHPLQCSMEPE